MVNFVNWGYIMKFNNRFKLLSMYLLIFLMSSLGLSIFRNLGFSSDLFNQINIASVLCGLIIFFCLIFLKKINYENVILLFLVSLFFFTSHQMVLLNVDRSRSYFVIGWVHEGNIKVEGNLYNYDNVYSPEKKNIEAADFRLAEQIDRGYVIQKNQVLELSTSGKFLYQIAELLSGIYYLNTWKINNH
jgi:hypothetical protein